MKKHHNYEDLGFAKIDHHRQKRKGFPEVIYCEGKTPAQVAQIATRIVNHGQALLATRADRNVFKAVRRVLKTARYHRPARIITVKSNKEAANSKSNTETRIISIITGGTADLPVAEEAAVSAEFLGHKVERLYDVGVAGIHRLFNNMGKVKEASVIIVVAGMEGALPSVVAGLVDKPIIAVPTSIGYGSSFKGLSALLTMLNSCAPGISVVNIDNGFGAAICAHYILRCA